MLRDDRQMALNEVLTRCDDLVDRYRVAAQVVNNTAFSALMLELADERENARGELRDEVRRLGDLPQFGDSDREALEDLFTVLRAKLGSHPDESVRGEFLHLEAALTEAIDHAIEQDLPETTREVLDRLRRASHAARNALNRRQA